MHYTIVILEECQMGEGVLKLNIDKTGNKYLVGLYNTDTKEYTHRTFDRLDGAYKIFGQLSEWIVRSYYTEREKRNYLLNAEV